MKKLAFACAAVGAALLVSASAASATVYFPDLGTLGTNDNNASSSVAIKYNSKGNIVSYTFGNSAPTPAVGSSNNVIDLGIDFTIAQTLDGSYVDALTTAGSKSSSSLFGPGSKISLYDVSTGKTIDTAAFTGNSAMTDFENLAPGTYTEFVEGSIVAPNGVSSKFIGSTDLTVSVFTGSAVPEPATWALMLAGVGMMGVALRQRRRPALAGATTA